MAMKKIVVVGVGALGSHFVQFARSIPDASISVVDDDRVESKNTLSQLHGKPGLGKLKTESLKGTMQFLWGIKLEVFPVRLTADNVATLLGRADLVVDALDNAGSRRVVQDWVRLRNEGGEGVYTPIALLHGALAPADQMFGQVMFDERFVCEDGAPGGAVATCVAGEALPFVGVVASFMALSAQAWLDRGERYNWQVGAFGARRF